MRVIITQNSVLSRVFCGRMAQWFMYSMEQKFYTIQKTNMTGLVVPDTQCFQQTKDVRIGWVAPAQGDADGNFVRWPVCALAVV